MGNFSKELKNIITSEFQNINEKLTGINFLETLKFNLIPKISEYIELSKDLEDLKDQSNLLIEKDNTKLEVVIFNINDPISKFKEITDKNILYIVISGLLSIDIFKNNSSKDSNKISIYPLTGVCLSPNTLININSTNKSIFLKFFKTDINLNIEN